MQLNVSVYILYGCHFPLLGELRTFAHIAVGNLYKNIRYLYLKFLGVVLTELCLYMNVEEQILLKEIFIIHLIKKLLCILDCKAYTLKKAINFFIDLLFIKSPFLKTKCLKG